MVQKHFSWRRQVLEIALQGLKHKIEIFNNVSSNNINIARLDQWILIKGNLSFLKIRFKY